MPVEICVDLYQANSQKFREFPWQILRISHFPRISQNFAQLAHAPATIQPPCHSIANCGFFRHSITIINCNMNRTFTSHYLCIQLETVVCDWNCGWVYLGFLSFVITFQQMLGLGCHHESLVRTRCQVKRLYDEGPTTRMVIMGAHLINLGP